MTMYAGGAADNRFAPFRFEFAETAVIHGARNNFAHVIGHFGIGADHPAKL
jgi:hypothetical protein